MRIQTFSVVAGSEACNAHCPFCVARMTPSYDEDLHEPTINWRNFDIGCRFAKDSGVSTVLITGKGEPTLFPRQITKFLVHLRPFRFPFVELQTNGIALARGDDATRATLGRWYDAGLTLVALSVVDCDDERNHEIYRPAAHSYYDLRALVETLHDVGFAVRLSCTMIGGYVDDVAGLDRIADFARQHGVEQLTLRPVEAPASSRDAEARAWVEAHRTPRRVVDDLRDHLDRRGKRLLELMHGAVVYDYCGQNVCLSNCLTLDSSTERIRQLIFFPDGHLRYDWQYRGAIIL